MTKPGGHPVVLGGSYPGSCAPPSLMSGQAKGINAKELQAVNLCGGGKYHIYLLSKFGVEFC